MTRSGVALHRSLYQAPAPACWPITRPRIRPVPYVQVVLARIRKTENIYERSFAYKHRFKTRPQYTLPVISASLARFQCADWTKAYLHRA